MESVRKESHFLYIIRCNVGDIEMYEKSKQTGSYKTHSKQSKEIVRLECEYVGRVVNTKPVVRVFDCM